VWLGIVENASNEVIPKPLDVDGVNTLCKFLVGIEMYALRDTIKNKHCYFKKN